MGRHEDSKKRRVPEIEVHWPGKGSDHIAHGFDTSPCHMHRLSDYKGWEESAEHEATETPAYEKMEHQGTMGIRVHSNTAEAERKEHAG